MIKFLFGVREKEKSYELLKLENEMVVSRVIFDVIVELSF